MQNFTFVLDNVRSAFNVGAIFRIADGILFNIHLIGITPYPSDSKIKNKLEKTSLSAFKHVKWHYFKNVQDWYEYITLDKDFLLLSIENKIDFKNSISLFNLNNLRSIISNSKHVYVCLGHEINGVSEYIIHKSHYIVYLPMEGFKTSLNVSSCAGIVGYFIKYILIQNSD